MGILRWIIVTISVVVLTTLGINAFDNLDQPSKSLLGAALLSITGGEAGLCPDGMVYVGTSDGGFCIDAFEASANNDCQYKNPQTKQETDSNLSLSSCKPVSVEEAIPWRSISRQQAELACARSGKRLPSSREWYKAALGTPDKDGWGKDDCNLDNVSSNEPDKTGTHKDCVSPSGAFDMIGNVWEWLEETVENGAYKGQTLPADGYVVSINDEGVPIETRADIGDDAFFKDYFWFESNGTRGMFRGGYWKSETDGGQYALNVTVPPSFVGSAVGFRCVKDIEK